METKGDLLLNFCHHVRGLVWVCRKWFAWLTPREPHFRLEIILATIPGWFLVLHIRIPGCSRNGSRVLWSLWVQEQFVRLKQSTQNMGLCLAEILGQFFDDSAYHLIGNLWDKVLINSRNGRVPRQAVPRKFLLCFSWNGCQHLVVCQCLHLFEGKLLNSSEDWIIFFNFNELESKANVFFLINNKLSSINSQQIYKSRDNIPEYQYFHFYYLYLFFGRKYHCSEAKLKHFNHINYKVEMLTLAGNKQPSVHIFPQRPCLLHL